MPGLSGVGEGACRHEEKEGGRERATEPLPALLAFHVSLAAPEPNPASGSLPVDPCISEYANTHAPWFRDIYL